MRLYRVSMTRNDVVNLLEDLDYDSHYYPIFEALKNAIEEAQTLMPSVNHELSLDVGYVLSNKDAQNECA